VTKAVRHEREARERTKIVPLRSTLPSFPRWMERIEELFGERLMSLWPALRWPEELAALRMPPVDLFEEGDAIVAKVELPGMKREEVEVTLTEGVLTIAGKKEKEEKIERKDYHRLERASGAFRRSIRLPAEVRVEAVTAKLENGVLEVRAPRSEPGRPPGRKVEIG
jgi:HSP20 family protein